MTRDVSRTALAHGTRSRYVNYGCRCAACTEANRAYIRRLVDARRQIPLPKHVSHGTYNAYNQYGCRCKACTEANRRQTRETTELHKQQPLPGHVKHGTGTAYRSYGCRCDRCRAWRSEDNRKQYLATKAKRTS